MKRINIISLALFVYLTIMGIIGWPGHNPETTYTEYFCMIGATIGIILLLRYLQIKRWKMRNKQNEREEKSR